MSKICDYCSENEASFTIPNPNIGDDFINWWDVCKGCKEAIKDSQKKDIEMIMEVNGYDASGRVSE